MSDTCFMIQPFDGGKFDKRFEDVFQPAVVNAGLAPYRVDRDASVSIPIDEIERGIKAARLCFVDITVDNPNVWFELGFAISAGKDLCLVSSRERTRYPFDVQHRTIIGYDSDSPRDFADLSQKITARLLALLKKQDNIQAVTLPNVSAPKAGLQSHEISCLAAIAAEINGLEAEITNFQVKREMDRMGYNNLACQIDLRSILKHEYITMREAFDRDGDRYELYSMTSDGWNWVTENVEKLDLNRRPDDDEIPF